MSQGPARAPIPFPTPLTAPDPHSRVWVDIDLAALTRNLRRCEALLPEGCTVLAVVKANAYGHGLVPIARHLASVGVRAFAVSCLEEAAALRAADVPGDLLIMGYTDPALAPLLAQYGCTQTLLSLDYAQALSGQGVELKAAVKVDTGMNRLGERAGDLDRLAACYTQPHLTVTSSYTHLCQCDNLSAASLSYSQLQIRRFEDAMAALRQRGIDPGLRHIQASYGMVNESQLSCEAARIGIALYGAVSPERSRIFPTFEPVLSLSARVALVKDVPAGEGVGYNHTFVACRPSRIAVVAAGYADGIDRNLSNRGWALVRGRRTPIVGNVCMGQLTLDVTGMPGVATGDRVVLIGRDGDETLTALDMAEACGSIVPQTLSAIPDATPRLYHA